MSQFGMAAIAHPLTGDPRIQSRQEITWCLGRTVNLSELPYSFVKKSFMGLARLVMSVQPPCCLEFLPACAALKHC